MTSTITKEQDQHLVEIKTAFLKHVHFKYIKGVEEHGGNLWDLPLGTLIDYAMDEAVDLYTYLYTIKQKLDKDISAHD